jgi:hypothetical protein
VEAELRVDCGAVVVVVVLGVAVVAVVADVAAVADVAVVADVAAVEVDVVPDTVVGVVAVATDEWAVLPEATRTPSPTAPADAARPMPAVARRTRVMARSRARTAAWGEGRCGGDCGAMVRLSLVRRAPLGPSAVRISVRP